MQTQDERYAHINEQLQAQNERLDTFSTSMNDRYAAFSASFELQERSIDESFKHLNGVTEYLSSLADPYKNPGICYHPGHRHYDIDIHMHFVV